MKKIAIIGAGIAGLTLANLIKNRNKQFGGGIAHSDSADARLREFIKKSNL